MSNAKQLAERRRARRVGPRIAPLFALTLTWTSAASAFPPYRSTDAETADPWTLEGRLGLVRWVRDDGENEWISPLVRANFGFPYRLELTTEFEYVPEDQRLGDAAAGIKWVPYFERLSLGIEALVLLPVSSAGGAGAEPALLATYRFPNIRLHANLGAFYDARPEPAEQGLKAGLLGELELGGVRPGTELFARRIDGEELAVQAGAGVIVDVGPIALRAGVHAGLTEAAPDVTASIWISGAVSVKE